MKYILIAVAALTISCDYNLKTDQELARYRYEIEDILRQAEVDKAALTALLDSSMVRYQKEKKMRQRLQDSLIWGQKRSIQCWEKEDHRHSCQSY